MKVVIIGGGWAGCAAAITAKKAGAEVSIYEKSDLLLGVGNVGGIMRNNGRYTAAEELINLGAGDLIQITDSNARHKNVDFPEHKHATLCDVNRLEPEVRRHLLNLGIEINLTTRVSNVEMEDKKIKALRLSDNTKVEGDMFIDCTGSTGAMDNCAKYGNGCVMCVLRCPTFGPRVSISAKAGVQDIVGQRANGTPGAFSGSCEVSRDSISEELLKVLDEKGVAVLKVPKEDINPEKLKLKVCQQYALDEFAENLVLLDTGHIKVMSPFYPLEKLRKLPGLEDVRFMDPYSGGVGNSIRYLAAAPRNNALKVVGVENLFCAGEKSGFFVGHTEAMCTGSLAGHNAVRYFLNLPLLVLPNETAIGDIIYYSNYRLTTSEGRKVRHTFSGAEYFERMKKLGLYSTDNEEIKNRIEDLGLTNVFNKKFIQ
ncbi:FAD-dependent oxidoreductase [Clostridium swellfunianum]|uniref:FAD-dependent oxidoreductase n=1 Tax=Clostridium swellfunianum TaxID=1367462 RepID=UPI00202FC174|nr:FAD-dependent oxidoreductase [Clostridium swellfunianum]MCM0648262.1 FAD-dependent oxidoreductase [Clostridium swellfunianum]